jgi:hypothetical protein
MIFGCPMSLHHHIYQPPAGKSRHALGSETEASRIQLIIRFRARSIIGLNSARNAAASA